MFNAHYRNSVIKNPNGKSKKHPTQKPVRLFEQLIKVSSNEGDLVFDPCIGSGTTAVACKNLKRNYIGCEASKKYYEEFCKRMKNECR